MTKVERLATVCMGRRLESIRHSKRLTATAVAERMGMRVQDYRMREVGRRQITIAFLCRAKLALKVPIDRLWFSFPHPIEIPDESTIEAALIDLLERSRPVTLEQVLEAASEAFQVPVFAVTSGDGRKRVNQVRTAAALVVESIPHLKLVELACLVRRSPRRLVDARCEAQREGKEFWSKVAAIRAEVESL